MTNPPSSTPIDSAAGDAPRSSSAKQLVESLGLPFVVAQDDRRHPVAHETLELANVAVDCLRRSQRKRDVRLRFAGVDRRDRSEPANRLERDIRRIEEHVTAWRVFAAAARQVDVVLRIVPRPAKLRLDVRAARDDEQRVGRKQRQNGSALESLARVLAHEPIDGKNQREVHRSAGPLCREIEVAQVDDLIAPELGAHRLGHAERVGVEDSAANAELRDVLDHGYTLKADGLEVRRQLTQSVRVAFAQLDAQLLERPRHSRFLEQRAAGREQDAQLAARQPLERLDSLSRDFHVRLGFAESFARGIERDRRVGEQRLEIGEPAFRLADAVRRHDEESRGQSPREGRDHRGVRGPGKTAGDQPIAGRRQRVEYSMKSRKTLDRVEQRIERHQATRRLRAPMTIASTTSMSERNHQRGLDERATRRGAKRLRRPRAGVRYGERSLGAESVAQLIRGVAIEHRLIRRRIHHQCANAPVGASEEVRSGARRHVERLTERRALPARQLDRVRPARSRELPARLGADHGSGFADQSLGEHRAEPRNKHRANRQVRCVGRERRPNEHVFRSSHDPRIATDDGKRFGRGARLRDKIVARAHADSVETRAAHGGLTGSSRAVSPRNSRSLERAVRRAQPHGIERGRDQRGHRRQLVGRDDVDVTSFDDPLARSQHVDRVLHERSNARRQCNRRSGSDPHGEMANVVARKLVGFQLDGAGHPSTLGRRRLARRLPRSAPPFHARTFVPRS